MYCLNFAETNVFYFLLLHLKTIGSHCRPEQSDPADRQTHWLCALCHVFLPVNHYLQHVAVSMLASKTFVTCIFFPAHLLIRVSPNVVSSWSSSRPFFDIRINCRLVLHCMFSKEIDTSGAGDFFK